MPSSLSHLCWFKLSTTSSRPKRLEAAIHHNKHDFGFLFTSHASARCWYTIQGWIAAIGSMSSFNIIIRFSPVSKAGGGGALVILEGLPRAALWLFRNMNNLDLCNLIRQCFRHLCFRTTHIFPNADNCVDPLQSRTAFLVSSVEK